MILRALLLALGVLSAVGTLPFTDRLVDDGVDTILAETEFLEEIPLDGAQDEVVKEGMLQDWDGYEPHQLLQTAAERRKFVFAFPTKLVQSDGSGSSADAGIGSGSEDECVDDTNSDGTAWHDADGSYFDCEWYSRVDRCDQYGSGESWDNENANQACCTCGGGSTSSDDSGSGSGSDLVQVDARITGFDSI